MLNVFQNEGAFSLYPENAFNYCKRIKKLRGFYNNGVFSSETIAFLFTSAPANFVHSAKPATEFA